MERIDHPIPPLYDESSRILILGSFPSVKSREAMFFYGHPQNRFWPVLAAVLGSALNLYHYLGFYDKFVHYTSGIVLAEGGLILIHALAGRRHTPAEPLLCRLFSMFFAIAGAGIWEIYEFTADNLLGINMQGDNTNTMGDIISGTLGALTWFGIHTLMHKRQQARQ